MKAIARSRSFAALSIAGCFGGALACGATAVEIQGVESRPEGPSPPKLIDAGIELEDAFPEDGDSVDCA